MDSSILKLFENRAFVESCQQLPVKCCRLVAVN